MENFLHMECVQYNIAVHAKTNNLQEKPQLDDSDVLYCRIPDSILAIRIWPGGLDWFGLYCLDFFDVVECTPMNTPNGYVISCYPQPGVFTSTGNLVSWETAAGLCEISPGMEKYSAHEGSRLVLTHPGKTPYYFKIPCRSSGHEVVFVQPRAGIPY
ncbi:hypothetical protein SCLCIDRAFT_1152246 [Scleroderma citrinum Foug A]|uniref:Uncharacterized protein n=1 Tax=Scleroderma citrinum Foug A TaxID=1036808 RepID=A0A0C2ZQ15_9AGAM|nr:hypothetical protein SCLCIDRAFT_1152246 [Scleroderma citrinum Foug A]